MKKVIILISAFALMVALTTSCKSSNKCAAYGENHKYQKETRY